MLKKLFMICLVALCIPYVTTLAFTGVNPLKEIEPQEVGKKRVLLDRGGASKEMNVEDYLVGVLAKQIDPSYQPEVLKAQAMIARTYLYRQMGEEDVIPESALDVDYLEVGQMESLWGSASYMDYYKKLRQAISDTNGMTIQYEGLLIDPLFHRISTGHTRQGDQSHPYIQPVDNLMDLEAEEYLSVTTLSKEEMAEKISRIPGKEGVPPEAVFQTMQIVEKDQAGYIISLEINGQNYTGEEIQYALDLSSPCFAAEEYEGGIRLITKGKGHGYGFSQYGANERAKEGWTAEDLLKYYYKNIVVIFE